MIQDVLNTRGANNLYLCSMGSATQYAGINVIFFAQNTSLDGLDARVDIPIYAYGRNMTGVQGASIYIAPSITGFGNNFYATASYIDINGEVISFAGTYNIGTGGSISTGAPDTRDGFRVDDIVAVRITWSTSSQVNGFFLADGDGSQLGFAIYYYNKITLTQPLISPPSGGYLGQQTFTITTTDPLDGPWTFISSSLDNNGLPDTSQNPPTAVTGTLTNGGHVIQALLATHSVNPYDNNGILFNFSGTAVNRYWINYTLAAPIVSLPGGWYLSPPNYQVTNPNVYDATTNPGGLFGITNNALGVSLNNVAITPSGTIPVGAWTFQAVAVCPGFYNSPTVVIMYYVGLTLAAPSISVLGQAQSPTGFYSGPVSIQVTDNNPAHPNPILTVLDTNGAVLASTASRNVTLTLPLGNHHIQAYSSGQGAYQSAVTSTTFELGRKIKTWNGSAWVQHPVKIWNGSAWVQHTAKIWNGFNWG